MRVPLRWVAGWALLTALVAAAVLKVAWGEVLASLQAARPGWLAFAVAANALILLLATAQWRLLLPAGARVDFGRLFSIVALSASVSNGSPVLVGQAAGVRLLATRGGIGHAGALSVTLLDQAAEGLVKVVLVGLAIALVPGFQGRSVGLAVLLGAPLLALALALAARRADALDRLAAAATGRRARVLGFVARLARHLEAIRRPRDFAAAVSLGVAKKGGELLGLWAAATALGVTVPAWALVAILAAVNLPGLASMAPANLGYYEAAAFLVLRTTGVEQGAALALAVTMHAAHLLPLLATGWLLEAGRGWSGARRREAALLAGIGALGVAIHAWFALGGDALDTDRALVLLMARAFAEGDFSPYFWAQNYMGALEPLLLTPLAAAGWATPVAAGMVGLALTAALAALSVKVARRLGGARWLVLLLWAVPPAVVVHHHIALYGARLAATVLSLAAFTWALRSPGPRGWVGVGALLGVAWFGDHLMLPWVAATMWVAVARGGLGRLAMGALPLVALDAVAAALTPAAHLSGPNDPGHWLWNLPRLFAVTLPQLFGLLLSRGPSPIFEAPLSVLPPAGWLWPALALPGLAALGALGATLVRRRRELFGEEAGERGMAARALLLACFVALALFTFTGGGGDRWPARYLVPLWPAFSVMAALAAARWPARLRPLAAAAVLPAVFTLAADPAWPRAGDGPPARAEAEAVGETVRESGARAVWADYWDAYRMALLAGDDPPWFAARIIERRPDLARAALEAGPVAYLAHVHDAELLGVLDRASAQGIRRTGDQTVGPYRFVVLERAAPGVPLIPPPPPRWWQALAAAGAGLLFLGTLAGMALAPRLLRRWPGVLGVALALALAAPRGAGAQVGGGPTPPRPTVEGAGADTVPGGAGALRVFSGLPYGSHALTSPVTLFVTKGYEIMQLHNHRRDIWTYPYGRAGSAVWDAVLHPAAAVRRGGGWGKWLKEEVFPFAARPEDAKWFPNYTEHLIGGGMSARIMTEWYDARGYPYPSVWGGVTVMASAFMNEVVENRGERVGSSGNVADLYIFDLGGIFLLRWDPLARFLAGTLRMSDWSPISGLTFPEGEVHNTGQYFVYKIPLPWTDRTRILWRLGLGSQLGATYALDGEHSLGIGFGVDTERRHVHPVTLEESIEVVRSMGVFWDRNDSLLASLMLSERLESMVAVSVYPGVLPGVGRDLGVWATVARSGTLRLGLAHRRALGLGVGVGF